MSFCRNYLSCTLIVTKLQQLGEFGDMTTLHMGSQIWVFLNSNQVIGDILAKNSKITSERPHMPVASELLSNGNRSVVQREQQWNKSRRTMRLFLAPSSLKSYGDFQTIESIQLLRSYMEKPREWHRHHARYTASWMYRSVAGVPFPKSAADLEEYQVITLEFLGSILRSPVDFFPLLRYIPTSFQFWRRFWTLKGKIHRGVFERWWNPSKITAHDGPSKAAYINGILHSQKGKDDSTEEEAMYLANSIMAAGGDNTRIALNAFVMASVLFPEVFHRARAEIDTVCGAPGSGSLRLPEISDMQSMPYMEALVKEVLRWRPAVPMPPPHQLTEALSYKGYHFPPGTNFLINNVASSKRFEEPERFWPERWLRVDESGSGNEFYGFGAGRRICVGYKLADQGLFLAFARLIYCYDYSAVSGTR